MDQQRFPLEVFENHAKKTGTLLGMPIPEPSPVEFSGTILGLPVKLMESDRKFEVGRLCLGHGGVMEHSRRMDEAAMSNPTVECLNRAFAADPNAILSLIRNRVPCNQALADDPTIIVDCPPISKSGIHWQVGMLGLLNGILRENGLPIVGTEWSEETDEEGRQIMIGFCEPEMINDKLEKEQS